MLLSKISKEVAIFLIAFSVVTTIFWGVWQFLVPSKSCTVAAAENGDAVPTGPESTGQKPELVVQTGHLDSIFSVAFSPDGK